MKRDSFVFYKSWWDAVGLLPGELRGEVLTAIIEYGLLGETNSAQGNMTKAILELIKPQIDVNRQKYENGKKGGRPKVESDDFEKPNGNQTETKRKPKINQTETKDKPNVYDNVYVNVNDYSSSRVREEIVVSEEEKKEFFKIFFWNNSVNPAVEVDKFISWNQSHGWLLKDGKIMSSESQRAGAAALWKTKQEKGRVPPAFLDAWKQLHDSAPPEVADAFLDAMARTEYEGDKVILHCRPSVSEYIEANLPVTAPVLKKVIGKYKLVYRCHE